jgi:hypothetical protein
MSKKPLPTYLPVWESQFQKIKNLIKEEIKKPKKERKKQHLKRMLEECKELKYLIKSIKDEHDKTCPHCGGKL